MIEVFADTNIIIDFLIDRIPFSENAAQILTLAEQKLIIVNVCALSYSNIYYVLKKFSNHKQILKSLESLSLITTTLPVDYSILQKSLKSGFMDFEDAIQYYCALQNNNCRTLITRNPKDFKTSEIAVMSPEIFLKTRQLSG